MLKRIGGMPQLEGIPIRDAAFPSPSLRLSPLVPVAPVTTVMRGSLKEACAWRIREARER